MADAAAWSKLRRHWPLLPALTVGAFLRFWGLGDGFLYGDEAEYATVARSLAADWRDLSYPELEGFGKVPFVSQPPLLLYLFAMGIGITGSAEFGPVLVSAILGTGTIVIAYAFGVVAADRRTGAIAAALIAVLPFHVSSSRSAMLDAGFTFFFAAAMLALVLWLRRPTSARAVLLGCAIAATAASKLPGVLVVAPVAAALVWLAFAAWRGRQRAAPAGASPAAWRRPLHGLPWLFFPSFVVGAAYLALLVHLEATRDLLLKLGWQAQRVAGDGASAIGPRGWDWYLSEERIGFGAQYGWILLLLAVAGLALCLRILVRGTPSGRAPAAVVVAWVGVVLGFFFLSERKEWFYPLPAAPALCILAAVAIVRAADLATRGLARARASTGVPSTVADADVDILQTATPRRNLAPFLVLAAITLATAFAPATVAVAEATRTTTYGYGVKEAALRIQEEDPAAAQVGTLLGRFSLHMYNGQPTYHYFVNHTFVEQEAAAGRLRFVVLDTYLNIGYERVWLESLVERYGGTLVEEFDPGPGRATTRLYELA